MCYVTQALNSENGPQHEWREFMALLVGSDCLATRRAHAATCYTGDWVRQRRLVRCHCGHCSGIKASAEAAYVPRPKQHGRLPLAGGCWALALGAMRNDGEPKPAYPISVTRGV